MQKARKKVQEKTVQQSSGVSLEGLENMVIRAFGGLEKVQFSDEGPIASYAQQSSLHFQPVRVKPADCQKAVRVTKENHVQELFDLLGVPLELRAALREIFFSNPSLVLAQMGNSWLICQNPDPEASEKEVPALLLSVQQQNRKKEIKLAPYDRDTLRDVAV